MDPAPCQLPVWVSACNSSQPWAKDHAGRVAEFPHTVCFTTTFTGLSPLAAPSASDHCLSLLLGNDKRIFITEELYEYKMQQYLRETWTKSDVKLKDHLLLSTRLSQFAEPCLRPRERRWDLKQKKDAEMSHEWYYKNTSMWKSEVLEALQNQKGCIPDLTIWGSWSSKLHIWVFLVLDRCCK